MGREMQFIHTTIKLEHFNTTMKQESCVDDARLTDEPISEKACENRTQNREVQSSAGHSSSQGLLVSPRCDARKFSDGNVLTAL